MENPCDLNDLMRAIGNLEGEMKGISSLLTSHGEKLDDLQKFKNQVIGKQTMLGAFVGLIAGIVGSLIQGGYFHK